MCSGRGGGGGNSSTYVELQCGLIFFSATAQNNDGVRTSAGKVIGILFGKTSFFLSLSLLTRRRSALIIKSSLQRPQFLPVLAADRSD